MNLRAVAVRSVAWTTAGQSISFVSTLIANLFLVRLIDAALFGELAIATSLVEILGFVASFAVNQAVLQYSDDGERSLAAAVLLSLCLAGVLALLGVTSCLVLRNIYGGLVVVFAAWLFGSKVLQVLTAPYLALYERRFEYFNLSALRLGTAAIAMWTAVLIASRGWRIESLIVRAFAADSLTFLFILVNVVPRVGLVSLAVRAERPQLRATLKFGLNVWVLRTLEQVLYNADVLVIQYWFPSSRGFQLGCYSQAKYIAGLPNTFASSLSQTLAYRLYTGSRTSARQLGLIANGITRILSRALIPFTLVLVLYPETVLRLLYGNAWLAAAPMLRVLGVYSLIVSVYSNLRSLLVALERWRQLYRIYACALVTYVVLSATPANQNIYSSTVLFISALVVVLLMSWYTASQTVSLDTVVVWRVPLFVAAGSAALTLLLTNVQPALTQRPILGLFLAFAASILLLALLDRDLVLQVIAAAAYRAEPPAADTHVPTAPV